MPSRGTTLDMQAGKVRLSAAVRSVDFLASALELLPAEPAPVLPSVVALVLCRVRTRAKGLPTRSIGRRTAIAWQDGSASRATLPLRAG